MVYSTWRIENTGTRADKISLWIRFINFAPVHEARAIADSQL